MLAADIRARCARRSRRLADSARRDVQAAFRVLVDRLRALLPDAGRQAAQGDGVRRHRSSRRITARREAAWKRHRERRRGRSRRPIERGGARVPARSERRPVARRVAHLRSRARAVPAARSTRTRCSISPACSSARSSCSSRWTSSPQSRYGSKRAISTCSSTSSRTPAARSGSSCAQLVRSWGEGLGAAADALAPSIFIVGDRKQSIYGFRDADVAVLDEAAEFVGGLRPDGAAAAGHLRQLPRGAGTARVRQRRVRDDRRRRPTPQRRDAFRYADDDRFPIDQDVRLPPDATSGSEPDSCVRLSRTMNRSASSPADRRDAAERVADEIARLLSRGRRGARSADRRRAAAHVPPTSPSCSARATAIATSRRRSTARHVPTYVYKGLGFFDADEMQDARGAAAVSGRSGVGPAGRGVPAVAHRPAVRSRRRALGRRLADALGGAEPPKRLPGWTKRTAASSSGSGPRCRAGSTMVDRMPPSELLDECSAKRRTRSRCAGRAGRRRART